MKCLRFREGAFGSFLLSLGAAQLFMKKRGGGPFRGGSRFFAGVFRGGLEKKFPPAPGRGHIGFLGIGGARGFFVSGGKSRALAGKNPILKGGGGGQKNCPGQVCTPPALGLFFKTQGGWGMAWAIDLESFSFRFVGGGRGDGVFCPLAQTKGGQISPFSETISTKGR